MRSGNFSTTRLRRFGSLLSAEAEVVGPGGRCWVELIVDTAATATTLSSSVVERIGYSAADGYEPTFVQTVIGREDGYMLYVAELTVFSVWVPNFAVMVSPLRGIEGLVGMNFLRHFNFEIRPAEQVINLEILDPSKIISG